MSYHSLKRWLIFGFLFGRELAHERRVLDNSGFYGVGVLDGGRSF